MKREIECVTSEKPALQQARAEAADAAREFSDGSLELFLRREEMNAQVRFSSGSIIFLLYRA
jgi:hypothetical protein